MSSLFSITIKSLQEESVRLIGRKLNSDELYRAKKCIYEGMSYIVDITLHTAVETATFHE